MNNHQRLLWKMILKAHAIGDVETMMYLAHEFEMCEIGMCTNHLELEFVRFDQKELHEFGMRF